MTVAMKNLTACVLGGTGFVGQSVVAQLANAGCEIRIPTRHAARHRNITVLPEVRLIECDVHDPATLERLLAGCDVAVR